MRKSSLLRVRRCRGCSGCSSQAEQLLPWRVSSECRRRFRQSRAEACEPQGSEASFRACSRPRPALSAISSAVYSPPAPDASTSRTASSCAVSGGKIAIAPGDARTPHGPPLKRRLAGCNANPSGRAAGDVGRALRADTGSRIGVSRAVRQRIRRGNLRAARPSSEPHHDPLPFRPTAAGKARGPGFPGPLGTRLLVGDAGLEPATSALSRKRGGFQGVTVVAVNGRNSLQIRRCPGKSAKSVSLRFPAKCLPKVSLD
jgi:hypothetical protein